MLPDATIGTEPTRPNCSAGDRSKRAERPHAETVDAETEYADTMTTMTDNTKTPMIDTQSRTDGDTNERIETGTNEHGSRRTEVTHS